jgi:small-conductance mechanosensitive channel
MFQDGVLWAGDVIEFSSVKGKVVKLSLRTTWIRRQDGAITIIVNNNLLSGPIVSHTAKARLERRLQA